MQAVLESEFGRTIGAGREPLKINCHTCGKKENGREGVDSLRSGKKRNDEHDVHWYTLHGAL
jgi:hypothetical protein